MMVLALIVALAGQHEFATRMDIYLACLREHSPANIARFDRPVRARLYRSATAHCRPERQEAIAAAVRDRRPGQSEAAARALAIDIIDTLDPMSSCRVAGAQC